MAMAMAMATAMAHGRPSQGKLVTEILEHLRFRRGVLGCGTNEKLPYTYSNILNNHPPLGLWWGGWAGPLSTVLGGW